MTEALTVRGLTLDGVSLSPRELAVRFTDERGYFVSAAFRIVLNARASIYPVDW